MGRGENVGESVRYRTDALQQDWAETVPSVSMAETISAFSYALDLTEDAVPGHALRTCLLGMRLATTLQFRNDVRCSLYYALLMKDAGCSGNAARMCQIIGGGDDRAVKAGAKLEDWTRPHRLSLAGLRMLWHNVSPGAGPVGKLLRLVKIGATQHANNEEMIALRCDRGGSIVRKIGLGLEAAEGVRCLDEHWDGSGYPEGLRGTRIPLLARVACIAQHLDAFATRYGAQHAIETMNERAGRWFDPEIVRAANALSRDGSLWIGCKPEDHAVTREEVIDLAPCEGQHLNAASIDLVCEAFADIVDAKSPFTFRHSTGVRQIALHIADRMGFPAERMQFLSRAALLHDLGKLRVPNSILDKNGKPTQQEWQIIQEHPALTRQILKRISAFRPIAAVAGAHHEKLDGTGYPDQADAAAIPLEARLLAVADVYGALTEERPYRDSLTPQEALRLMEKDVPHCLDGPCFEALRFAMLSRPVAAPVSATAHVVYA